MQQRKRGKARDLIVKKQCQLAKIMIRLLPSTKLNKLTNQLVLAVEEQ